MTKASDNAFPSILITEGTEPSAPAAGKQRLYIDSTSHALMVVNSSGTETAVAGAAGSVATDAIWDVAGDLAVGSGANAAARLAIGAAGGAVSRVNGAVAWNSGTGNPTATTGDRYWRTDLGMEVYYDGTRWLTTTQYTIDIAAGTTALAASGAAGWGASPGVAYDLWCEYVKFGCQVGATNDASKYWNLGVHRAITAGGADTQIGTNVTTQSLTASRNHPLTLTVGALLGTNIGFFYLYCSKVSTPTDLVAANATIFYRFVIP